MTEPNHADTPPAERECVPCHGGVPPLKNSAVRQLLAQLGAGWKVVHGRRLEKRFAFRDFREALDFTNQVGYFAEQAQHHPDLFLAWGEVRVALWTHKIGGLAEADFVLAARIEALCRKRGERGQAPQT
jgi:4a-hydroxytetrahydrobiopterin dehydratase